MHIPENLKFDYLLSLDNHLETEGKDNKEKTLKRIFEITKKIADLGFGENDIHEIVKCITKLLDVDIQIIVQNVALIIWV